jgi:hypothetical protein
VAARAGLGCGTGGCLLGSCVLIPGYAG